MRNISTYKSINDIPRNDTSIFVFGSNTEGRHGKGSALHARKYFGAIYGQCKGFQGQSYGIITKNLQRPVHPSIPTIFIEKQINALYTRARNMKDKNFYIPYDGVTPNLNSYSHQELADMFNRENIPENIYFIETFAKLLTA